MEMWPQNGEDNFFQRQIRVIFLKKKTVSVYSKILKAKTRKIVLPIIWVTFRVLFKNSTDV